MGRGREWKKDAGAEFFSGGSIYCRIFRRIAGGGWGLWDVGVLGVWV